MLNVCIDTRDSFLYHRNVYLFACAICFLKREKIERSSYIRIGSFSFLDDHLCTWRRLVTILSQPNREHPSLSPVRTEVHSWTEEGNLVMQNVFKKVWISEFQKVTLQSEFLLPAGRGDGCISEAAWSARCECEGAGRCDWRCNVDK